jgi:DNA-binding transcriptional ArsR family regulator
MNYAAVLRAVANNKRLQLLDWLKHPTKHFPPQRDGDLIKDGVCGILIARKLKISQPTASEHLKILSQANLLKAKRKKGWTFYQRNESAIKKMKNAIVTRI